MEMYADESLIIIEKPPQTQIKNNFIEKPPKQVKNKLKK